MPSLVSRLAVAAVLSLVCAAPAYAVWEAPLPLDQTTEGFGNSGAGDVAVGNDGLATIVFAQNDDAGATLWATRRAAGAADWLRPPKSVTNEFTSGFTIEAGPDGGTAGTYLHSETTGGPVPPATTAHHLYGIGWPAAATDAGPKTGTFADQADAGLPPVDVDGNGFGWTAYVDGDDNLHIVRFSLANPATVATWEVPAVTEDPGEFSGDATESRSDPRIDVNAAGDVIVSFVEARRMFNQEGFSPPVDAIYAVRKLNGKDPGEAYRISHPDESEVVDEHDPAIADNADATVLFASDPERNTQEPNTSGPQRVYARRWLGTATEPRPHDTGGIELVSSSDETALDVSRLRAESGPEGRVTAAWSQGNAQLNSAERFGTWTLPETLSNNTAAFDITVDAAGAATAVYRENTVVRARRRAASQKWAAADAISTAAVPTDFTPKVDAGKADQADAYILQASGARRGAFATRFTGVAPVEPPAEFRPDTLDCPGDITVLAGDAGANSIPGGDGRETILGGDGDDTLFGGGGNDCIRGQGGNDVASGGSGDDDVGGGDGDDRVAGDEGSDRVHGGAGADRVNGGAGDDSGLGGDGNDTLDGADGNDTLNGELGDDKVRGGGGDDVLGGADGNDSLFGSTGTDTLFGGIGNDRLFGGPQNDTLLGEDGDDVVSGGNGSDNMNGGTGNDKLRGGNGRNTLDGAEGDDGMRGGNRSDRMLGSAGLDTLFGLGGEDRLVGGADDDKAYGGSNGDRVYGNAGSDRLRGGNGADRLFGGSGKDKLFGDSGKDRLFGGSGGDVLNGGTSRDRIFGGRGNDRISAADNKRDRINCGKGKKDRVLADKRDVVSKNCEKVRRKS